MIPDGIKMNPARTSLIVRCSPEDAVRARNEASLEHRSLSGYLLRVLEFRINIEDKLTPMSDRPVVVGLARSPGRERKEARTAVHLRCTVDEATKIRQYAARRRLSISDFVVFSLRRLWSVQDHLKEH